MLIASVGHTKEHAPQRVHEEDSTENVFKSIAFVGHIFSQRLHSFAVL
jgi:hypothetical protein